jgi:hypothetical protein
VLLDEACRARFQLADLGPELGDDHASLARERLARIP